mmetsp:Transcript_60183/g.160026  ORF Transcript_60183/g.160026 Transcript_60183/m.160026 type:complete len:387 (-) Transcript_60183:2279-3439(-)
MPPRRVQFKAESRRSSTSQCLARTDLRRAVASDRHQIPRTMLSRRSAYFIEHQVVDFVVDVGPIVCRVKMGVLLQVRSHRARVHRPPPIASSFLHGDDVAKFLLNPHRAVALWGLGWAGESRRGASPEASTLGLLDPTPLRVESSARGSALIALMIRVGFNIFSAPVEDRRVARRRQFAEKTAVIKLRPNAGVENQDINIHVRHHAVQNEMNRSFPVKPLFPRSDIVAVEIGRGQNRTGVRQGPLRHVEKGAGGRRFGLESARAWEVPVHLMVTHHIHEGHEDVRIGVQRKISILQGLGDRMLLRPKAITPFTTAEHCRKSKVVFFPASDRYADIHVTPLFQGRWSAALPELVASQAPRNSGTLRPRMEESEDEAGILISHDRVAY